MVILIYLRTPKIEIGKYSLLKKKWRSKCLGIHPALYYII